MTVSRLSAACGCPPCAAGGRLYFWDTATGGAASPIRPNAIDKATGELVPGAFPGFDGYGYGSSFSAFSNTTEHAAVIASGGGRYGYLCRHIDGLGVISVSLHVYDSETHESVFSLTVMTTANPATSSMFNGALYTDGSSWFVFIRNTLTVDTGRAVELKIYDHAGSFVGNGATFRRYLNADKTSFFTARIAKVVPGPAGTFYVSGDFGLVGSVERYGLVRMTTSGQVDESFNAQIAPIYGNSRRFPLTIVRAGGKLYLSHSTRQMTSGFTDVQGPLNFGGVNRRCFSAVYEATGALDLSYDPGGASGIYDIGYACEEIYCAGLSTAPNPLPDPPPGQEILACIIYTGSFTNVAGLHRYLFGVYCNGSGAFSIPYPSGFNPGNQPCAFSVDGQNVIVNSIKNLIFPGGLHKIDRSGNYVTEGWTNALSGPDSAQPFELIEG